MDNCRTRRRFCTALGLLLVTILTILVVLLTLRTTSAHSQPQSQQSQVPQSPLDGRWNVVLNGRDLHFETTFQFDTLPDGKVDAAVTGPLGPFNVVFTDGRFDRAQNKLSLNARTSYGPARFSGTVNGDTLDGHWSLTAKRFWFITLGTKGDLRGQRNPTPRSTPPAPPAKVFDAVWDTVNQRFYDPRFAGTDWQQARIRFRPQAQAARTEAQLVNVLRTMLATLRSSHVDFYAQTAPPTATSKGP
jgi:hypothetical protein